MKYSPGNVDWDSWARDWASGSVGTIPTTVEPEPERIVPSVLLFRKKSRISCSLGILGSSTSWKILYSELPSVDRSDLLSASMIISRF